LLTASVFESKYTGSDNVIRNTAFNGNYVINALAGKEFKIKTKHTIALDVKVVYAGGKRYVPIDLDKSILYNRQLYFNERAYSPQFDPYFRIDIKPSYRLNSKRVTHEVSVDIQNLTRHNNVFQQSFDISTKTIRTDYQLKFFFVPQYRLTF
jgi:hypothetical protein